MCLSMEHCHMCKMYLSTFFKLHTQTHTQTHTNLNLKYVWPLKGFRVGTVDQYREWVRKGSGRNRMRPLLCLASQIAVLRDQMLATAGGAVFMPITLQTRPDMSQSQSWTQFGCPSCTGLQSALQIGAEVACGRSASEAGTPMPRSEPARLRFAAPASKSTFFFFFLVPLPFVFLC